jgi:hypothetical protein
MRIIADLTLKTNKKTRKRNKTVLKNSNVWAKVSDLSEKTNFCSKIFILITYITHDSAIKRNS